MNIMKSITKNNNSSKEYISAGSTSATRRFENHNGKKYFVAFKKKHLLSLTLT